MITTVILTLIGIGAAAMMFDVFDSDSTNADTGDDDDTGEDITDLNQETITGSDGDDTISGNAPDLLDLIAVGDGDDLLEITAPSDVLIDCKGGNDSLDVDLGYYVTLVGGGGDGTLSISNNSSGSDVRAAMGMTTFPMIRNSAPLIARFPARSFFWTRETACQVGLAMTRWMSKLEQMTTSSSRRCLAVRAVTVSNWTFTQVAPTSSI